jgi:8-oxo-dGTP pyrophosphatase MutT (NUDIX family)
MMSNMPRPNRPTHAGGVVYRMRDGVPQFLLVTARRQPDLWVYPKGHVEPGETCEAAAAREVREEAGVRAEVVAQLDDVHIRFGGEDQLIRYFLMRTDEEGAPHEGRQSAWLPATLANERLPFAEARGSLALALDAMKARGLI